MQDILFEKIDWNLSRIKAMGKKSRPSKNAHDWDRKASSFAERNTGSLYTEKFIKLLQPQASWTVLDVGSGPGTLALPLAERVKHVTALDFSPKMLALLTQRAQKKKKTITNITTRNLSWTDDWQEHGIKKHDVAIASRSLAINDLRPALRQLTRFARKEVAITDRVGPGPFDPGAYKAVGRTLETGPDYIYTINLLYQMGIQASVNFIHLEGEIPCSSFDMAMEMYTWMFQDLSETEKKRLKKYVQSITTTTTDGAIVLHRNHIPTWAYIHWQPR